MIKSVLRANAIAALLLLCYGAYVVLDAHRVFRPTPSYASHAELVQSIKTESRPDVLRTLLLEKLQRDSEVQKSHDAMLTRTYEAVGLLAIFAAMVLASNALALRRVLRGRQVKL